jgi:serine/threonine-protein kinase RsbW
MRVQPQDSEPVTVTIVVPARAEFLHVVRTVVGSVSARANLTIDAIEDLRISVDEACAQLLVARGSTITVHVSVREGRVEVVSATDADVEVWPPEGVQHTLAAQVLQGLADDVSWDRDGAGPAVRVTKRGVPVSSA